MTGQDQTHRECKLPEDFFSIHRYPLRLPYYGNKTRLILFVIFESVLLWRSRTSFCTVHPDAELVRLIKLIAS